MPTLHDLYPIAYFLGVIGLVYGLERLRRKTLRNKAQEAKFQTYDQETQRMCHLANNTFNTRTIIGVDSWNHFAEALVEYRKGG